MPNNSSEAVFNLEALVFAGAVLFLILVVHALYMYITENWYEKLLIVLFRHVAFHWLARRFMSCHLF